jgi:UDP-glucose 4-epimerase
VSLHTVDLRDRNASEKFVKDLQPAWIFHLAAHGAYSSQTNVAEMIDTNYLCTTNLVHGALAAGSEVLVNTGSSSEYGLKDHAPDENEVVEPNSYYAVTKLAATQFCRFTARQHGLRIPTLRLYSVYGPYEEPKRLIPTLLLHALSMRWPPLVGQSTARDLIYTDDVIDAFLAVAKTPLADPGAIYNVGTGVQTTLGQLVTIVTDLIGVKAEPQWGTMVARSWDTSIWVANSIRLQSELGWKPRVSVQQGLDHTRAWFESHPGWRDYYEQSIDVFGKK